MVFKLISVLTIFFIASCSNADIDKLSDSLRHKVLIIENNSSVTINTQPIAIINIDENSILKEQLDITFSGESSIDKDGQIVSYIWRENKNIIGQESILIKRFEIGIHIIELEIKDNDGSINITRKQISIGRDHKRIELNLDSLEEVATLASPTKNINQISIENNYLFASSDDGNIYFWELLASEITNSKTIQAHVEYRVSSILLKDHRVFSGSNDNSIKIWSIDNEKKDIYNLTKTLNFHTNTISSMVANKKILASSSLDKSISIISLENNTLLQTLKGHKSAINNIVMIDSFLISSSIDRTINIWDMSSFENVNTIDLLSHKADFMLNYKSNIITASSDGGIIIWNIFKGAILKEIQTSAITAVEIYKDNIIFALNNGEIKYININTLKETNLIKLDAKAVYMKANEGILAIGLDNFTIRLFGNRENFKQR